MDCRVFDADRALPGHGLCGWRRQREILPSRSGASDACSGEMAARTQAAPAAADRDGVAGRGSAYGRFAHRGGFIGLATARRDSVRHVGRHRRASLREPEINAARHGFLASAARLGEWARLSLRDRQRRGLSRRSGVRGQSLATADDRSAHSDRSGSILRRSAARQLFQRTRDWHLPDRRFRGRRPAHAAADADAGKPVCFLVRPRPNRAQPNLRPWRGHRQDALPGADDARQADASAAGSRRDPCIRLESGFRCVMGARAGRRFPRGRARRVSPRRSGRGRSRGMRPRRWLWRCRSVRSHRPRQVSPGRPGCPRERR